MVDGVEGQVTIPTWTYVGKEFFRAFPPERISWIPVNRGGRSNPYQTPRVPVGRELYSEAMSPKLIPFSVLREFREGSGIVLEDLHP